MIATECHDKEVEFGESLQKALLGSVFGRQQSNRHVRGGIPEEVARFQIVVGVGGAWKRLGDEGLEHRPLDNEVLPGLIDQHFAAIQIDEAEGQKTILWLVPPKMIPAKERHASHASYRAERCSIMAIKASVKYSSARCGSGDSEVGSMVTSI